MRHLLWFVILSFSLLAVWLIPLPRSHGAALASGQTPVPPRLIFLPFVQQGSPTCDQVELVQDGGFEAGLPNPFWQVSSNVSSDILDDTPDPPSHSGIWKAWLGGDNLVQESLWQAIIVPADAANLQVSYWWRIDTFESAHPFDTVTVQIRDVHGNLLETLETLTDGDAAPDWQQSIFTMTTTYAGQTIQLAFVAETDDTNPTSFFLDDIGVLQRCP